MVLKTNAKDLFDTLRIDFSYYNQRIHPGDGGYPYEITLYPLHAEEIVNNL